MPNRTRSLPACRLGLLCAPLLFVALHAGAADHPNPLVAQRADPHVFRHSDGWYYFTATVPEYDRIELRRARALDQLGTAEPRVIWRKHPSGGMGSHIWAPEIHRIDGEWYVYFAAGGAEPEKQNLPNAWEGLSHSLRRPAHTWHAVAGPDWTHSPRSGTMLKTTRSTPWQSCANVPTRSPTSW